MEPKKVAFWRVITKLYVDRSFSMTTRSWRFYVGRALETGRNPVGARSFAGALRGA